MEFSDIKSSIKNREKFSHKGTFGSAQIIAGSEDKMGAAFLCGKACFLSGVGLVTLNIPGTGNEIIQTSLPEAMTIFNEAHDCISEIKLLEKTAVFCLGPDIGRNKLTSQAVEKFLKENPNKPLLLDADALNIIASKKELIDLIPAGSIVTPHAKEFERLLGANENSLGKIESMRNFSKETGIIVVSKGAHSVVSDVEGNLYFNNSGNPGMATAGSGDVLAGLITGLLAQSMNSLSAAMTGVFLHGLAGDIAEKKVGEMSLMASDLLNEIPKAISNVKNMVII
jgi:NAD(P)H-hydrate epimerase